MDAESGRKTALRTLATNEVVNVTRRFFPPEVFDAFCKEWHPSLGHVASLNMVNLGEVGLQLKL